MIDPLEGPLLHRWLHDELARYTYKPGWTFQVEPSGGSFDTWAIRIQHLEPFDPRFPPAELQSNLGGGRIPVPDFLLRELAAGRVNFTFGRWLAGQLLHIEKARLEQWLRRDGALIHPPAGELES